MGRVMRPGALRGSLGRTVRAQGGPRPAPLRKGLRPSGAGAAGFAALPRHPTRHRPREWCWAWCARKSAWARGAEVALSGARGRQAGACLWGVVSAALSSMALSQEKADGPNFFCARSRGGVCGVEDPFVACGMVVRRAWEVSDGVFFGRG